MESLEEQVGNWEKLFGLDYATFSYFYKYLQLPFKYLESWSISGETKKRRCSRGEIKSEGQYYVC